MSDGGPGLAFPTEPSRGCRDVLEQAPEQVAGLPDVCAREQEDDVRVGNRRLRDVEPVRGEDPREEGQEAPGVRHVGGPCDRQLGQVASDGDQLGAPQVPREQRHRVLVNVHDDGLRALDDAAEHPGAQRLPDRIGQPSENVRPLRDGDDGHLRARLDPTGHQGRADRLRHVRRLDGRSVPPQGRPEGRHLRGPEVVGGDPRHRRDVRDPDPQGLEDVRPGREPARTSSARRPMVPAGCSKIYNFARIGSKLAMAFMGIPPHALEVPFPHRTEGDVPVRSGAGRARRQGGGVPRRSPFPWLPRRWTLVTALLAVVLLVSLPTAPVTGPPAARGGDPYVHGGTSGPGKAVGTLAGSGSISAGPAFFRNVTSNSSNFYTQGNAPCFAPSAAIGASCDPWASNPNLLHLSNGGTGLVYAVGTTDSSVVCHGLPEGNTSSRLVFTASPASGQSWAGGTLLGQTASTCPYYQALEPAFTTNSSGGIVGVYVGANATFESMSFVSGVQGQVLNANYSNRSSDALIFTSSSDDGSTFSDGTILRAAGHHVARPAIATFGNSIYVLFENISNSTSLAPNVLPALAPPAGVASNTAISVWFMASTDGGSTWTSPEEMPGENATEFNNSMSPSISISASGEIAVAYLTDRACLAYCGSLTAGLEHYGDALVVLTSTSNGSTWSSIRTVFSGIGEPSYGNADRLYGSSGSLFFVFQYAPAPVLVWNTTGSQIYVAWSGSYNISSPGTLFYSGMYGDVDYSFPAIYVGTSTNGGSSWSVSRLTSVGNFTILGGYFAASLPTYDLDPGLAVSDGHVFVTYLEVNQTNAMSLSNCGYYGGSTYDSSLSQWLVESPNARDWSRTSLLAFQDGTNAPNAYLGPLSSMLAWNGTPTVAFPFPTGYRYLPWYGETADVEVATPYQGTTENVSFQPLSTLSSGAQEYIGVDGAPFAVGKSGLTLTGVPQDQWIVVNVSTGGVVPAGDTPLPEGQGVFLIEGNTTLTVGSQLFR